jgi:hypothetical protein
VGRFPFQRLRLHCRATGKLPLFTRSRANVLCPRGSPLTYRHDSSPDTVDVTTATLDFPDRFAPTREIWLEHKLAWEQLNENLAHYPRSSMEGQSISS